MHHYDSWLLKQASQQFEFEEEEGQEEPELFMCPICKEWTDTESPCCDTMPYDVLEDFGDR